jgi:predicted RNA polymerase sigma factor
MVPGCRFRRPSFDVRVECGARGAAPTEWRPCDSSDPIVELNRAVAVSMSSGLSAGLELVDQLRDTSALDGYHLLHSVRGDLLSKLDRHDEASHEFRLAASLTQNADERRLSEERALASAQLAAEQAERVRTR